MGKEYGIGSSTSPADIQSSKRIKLSLHPNQHGEDFNSTRKTSPLGLTLRKTPSLLKLVEMVLSQSRGKNDTNHASSQAPKEAGTNELSYQSQHVSEKLKASNFPALSIRIGSFERISRYEEELIAKCYYAKKKIVWEVLEGAVKSKMEIQWSDIEAIRATFHENEQGILEIELNQPPFFFKETNQQPRKHTLWQPTSDFTNDEALKCRRHTVRFAPGILDKHYDKLLKCDRRLLELSLKPFPSGKFPYFQPQFYPCNISFDRQQANVPTYLVPPHRLNLTADTHSQALNLGQQDGGVDVNMFSNQGEEYWVRDENTYLMENCMRGFIPSIASNTQLETNSNNNFGVENVLLSDKQFRYTDVNNLARVNSMCSGDSSDNAGIDHLVNIQENIGNSAASEIFKYNDGMIDSLPSSQGSDDYLMMMNYYYQYGLSNPKVDNYESLNANYVDRQWS